MRVLGKTAVRKRKKKMELYKMPTQLKKQKKFKKVVDIPFCMMYNLSCVEGQSF